MSTIHQIRVTLQGSKPPIWRMLAVPSNITLDQLHEVIQIAMGWYDCHLHHFLQKVKPTKISDPDLNALRKRGDIASILNLYRRERYFVPLEKEGEPLEMDGEDESQFALSQVCPNVGSKLTYEYDFGDGWLHLIEVKKVIPPEPETHYPRCLSAKGACPPEDCGGLWGYYATLHAQGREPEMEVDVEDINAALQPISPAEKRAKSKKSRPRRRRQ